MKKVYYIYPDFIGEIYEGTQEELLELVSNRKGEIYDNIDDFLDAFNNEMISDLGYAKAF